MDRIDDLTADVFNFLIQLRRLDANAQPPPETVLQRLRTLIDTMGKRAADLGFSREDVLEITYAIVALADEAAIYAGGNLRQYWMQRPLQLQYFNENVAGENFFARVMALRQDPRRIDAVRVYYTCLVLGFQGKYRVRGGEAELAAIMDQLAGDLSRAGLLGPELLSVHGDRPANEVRTRARADLPIVGLAAAAVAISLVLYVGLRISLGNEVSTVLNRIAQFVH
jgi:type VI secretion system protein ImpK